MRRRAIARLVILAACLALGTGAALPASGAADAGGVPHSSKPCPGKSRGHGPKRTAPNAHGKKCGFNRTTTTPPVDDGTDDGVDDGTGEGDGEVGL